MLLRQRIQRTFTALFMASLAAASCAPRTLLPNTAQRALAPNAQFQSYRAPVSAFSNSLPAGAYSQFKIDPRLPTSKTPRKAVKLTYLMTDDTAHQSPWSEVMLGMMDDLPQRDVHNIVFRDGNVSGDSKLYYIEQGDTSPNTLRNPQSSLAPGVNEVQSNNPMVFSEIVRWSFDNYPAQRKYLQIYTHGGAFDGIGTDENQVAPDGSPLPANQQKGVMSPSELNAALQRALRGRKIDVLYFRACLMGNLEALYELRGSVDYALASEDVSYSVENSNLVMTKLFDDLAAAGMEPRELARQMSIQAKAKRSGPQNGHTTMAAIDINRLTDLKSALNSLVKLLTASLPRYGPQIYSAYDAVPFMNEGAEEYMIRDLWAFTGELLRQVPDPAIQQATQQVRRAQEAATVHSKDIFGTSANGLSIVMPKGRQLTGKNTQDYIQKGPYQQSRLAKDTGWDEFLLALAPYAQ